MFPDVSGFDWDTGNREKCSLHGVTVDQIESLFQRPVAVFPDPLHSTVEQRFHAIGTDAHGRYIFLVFTFRERKGAFLLRPVSARYMHQKEIRHYEKKIAKTEDR